MRTYILAALLAGGFASPALAQDAAAFSGFRIEALGGYETTDVKNNNADGITYGVGVGFDGQSGNMVFGVEGEAAKSTMDECITGTTGAGDRLCAEAGRDLYVGGRVGAAIGTGTLVYAKAGYTNARVRLGYTAPGGVAIDTKDDLDGIRAGAGLQFNLGTNAFAKAEYRYSNYEQGFDKHQGLVGVGFRF